MMRVQCAKDFQGTSHLEQLVKMQHYDWPTRLLDITSNPLVALFFACNENGDKEGCVYVFRVLTKDVLFYDSDTVKILSALPVFSKEDKELLFEECVKKIKKHGKFDAPRNADIVEKLYKQIKTEDASFKKEIDPLTVLSAYFVQPLKDNNRILKQDGAFIIDGISRTDTECENKLSLLVTCKILIDKKSDILKELDALGINEATLFPEIDKVAHYLKGR